MTLKKKNLVNKAKKNLQQSQTQGGRPSASTSLGSETRGKRDQNNDIHIQEQYVQHMASVRLSQIITFIKKESLKPNPKGRDEP